MGISHNAYLGPYLFVTETVTEKVIDNCLDHNFPEDAAFCPKCGISKTRRFQTAFVGNAPKDWKYSYKKNGKTCILCDYLHEVSGVRDVISDGDKHIRTRIYLPNRYYDEIGIPKIDDDTQELQLDGVDFGAMSDKFAKIFEDEIVYIQQFHEVEIRFGYISYYS